MNKKKHLIFIAIMSIIVAFISFIPDFLIDSIEIKKGYLIVGLIVFLFLMLFYYRYLDYPNASFKRLLTTGVSILFFGMLLGLLMEMGHLSIRGEQGIQHIIDCKVETKIKSYSGTTLNIFKIEKDVDERVRYSGAKDILSMIFGFLALALLIFIFSLILRTDKNPIKVEERN